MTKVNSLYDSHFIPFLKLWDTRGIELNDEYGPNGILNNALEIINKTTQISYDSIIKKSGIYPDFSLY